MNNAVGVWADDRVTKLEKRLRHHRELGDGLPHASTLRLMNDRAINDMETKLFRLRAQAQRIRRSDV